MNQHKRIQVRYFAIYRDQVGCSEEELNTQASTAEDLFAELQQNHPELERFAAAKIAINDELKSWQDPIADGDRVLLFPPVAGG